MEPKNIPGTVLPETAATGMAGLMHPLLAAGDGLTLGQVCAITGLEPATVQNWIRRGFVAHPIRKKYRTRQVARILLIAALRDCLQIDRIGAVMTFVNGDTEDESDDIVSEEQLYDYFCESVRLLDNCEPDAAIVTVTADYRAPDNESRRRLILALRVMVNAYRAARYKQIADRTFHELAGIL